MSWITSKLISTLDYVLILAVEGSTKEYKEGEGPMENTLSTLSIWHFQVCVSRQLLIIIESLGQGLLSDFDSLIRFKEGQRQEVVRRTRSTL